jgi:poly-gamma-glutamate synthesis protein (capsule biosynthesis protein)
VQAAGWRGRTYVAYGLGNFVWHKNSPEPDATSGVLTLTLQGRRVVAHRWTPLVVSADGVPRPPSAARSRVLERRWSSARSCSDLSARPRRP